MIARLRVSIASVALVTSLATVARAGNDDGVLIGNQAIITGGAVTSIVSDGASAWYNPAGLGRSNRNQLDVTGSAYGLNIYKVKSLFRLPDGRSADASTTDWVLVPALLSFVREVSPDLVAGLAIFIPRTHDYDLRASVQNAAGEQFVATANSALYEYDYALSLAQRFSPNLRVGATVAGIYISRRDTNQIAAGAPDDAAAGFYNGSNLTTVGNYGMRLTAGVQWAPSPEWELGLSIQSPMLTGFSDVSRTVIQTSVSPAGMPHYAVDEQLGKVAVWDFTTPLRVRAGVAWQVGSTQWLLDGDISTPIDAPPELPDGTFVDRHWVGNGRIGMLHTISPAITVGAGVFTDLGGEEQFEMNYVGTAFGVALSTAHAVNGKAQDLVFSTTLGGRYAYGWGEIGGQNLSVQGGELVSEPIGASARVHELAFNLGGGVNF